MKLAEPALLGFAVVYVQELARQVDLQADLFQPATAGDPKMMETLDRINRRFGRVSIGFAATGW